MQLASVPKLLTCSALLLTQTSWCRFPSRFSTRPCSGDTSGQQGLRVTVHSDDNSLLDLPRS